MISAFEKIRDPGLQQERTVLAWDRTALAIMVAAGILERASNQLVPLIMLFAAVTFSLGLTLLVASHSRYIARWKRLQRGVGILSDGPVLIVSASTVLLGISALWLVIAH